MPRTFANSTVHQDQLTVMADLLCRKIYHKAPLFALDQKSDFKVPEGKRPMGLKVHKYVDKDTNSLE